MEGEPRFPLWVASRSPAVNFTAGRWHESARRGERQWACSLMVDHRCGMAEVGVQFPPGPPIFVLKREKNIPTKQKILKTLKIIFVACKKIG